MRNPARAPQLQALAGQEGWPVTVLPLDVDDDASVRGAVEHLLAARGRIDVLVNNAGIAPMGAIEELPLAEFRRTMETNYFGALRCIQAVLPTMRAQRQGCVINVTSVARRIALGATAPYTASKFALEALSEVLAQEVKAFNIRVAIVEPGVTQTPILDKMRDVPGDTRYPHEQRLQALLRPRSSNRCPQPRWASTSGALSRVRAGNCAIRWAPMPRPFSHGAPACRTRSGSTTTPHARTKYGTSTSNEILGWMPDYRLKLSSGRALYCYRTRRPWSVIR